jgi:SAM-dependent methyltransferase
MPVPLEAIAPGADAIVRLALEHVKPGKRVLILGSGQGALTALFSPYTSPDLVYDESAGERMDAVEAFDVVLCFDPSRLGPLVRVLQDFHESLAPGGVAVVSDVVWQTAPTPQLAQAFAPQPGREKVRPIEGYEMQIDHAGFDVVERLDFGRAEWLAHVAHHPAAGAQAAAIAADERGAARYSAWLLRPSSD